MIDHYDTLETREPCRARGRAVFAAAERPARGDGGTGLCRAAERPRSGHSHRPRGAGAPAGAAEIRTPRPAQGRPAVRRLRQRSPQDRLRGCLPRPGRSSSPRRPTRDPWRGARALYRGRVSARRRGAEHLQLSPHARRFHLRCLRARARLRGHPGRPRQYRGPVRADRSLPTDRLQRHAGLPEDPARRRRQRRAATSPRSSARWCRARRFRPRCRTRSSRAASTPIRPSAPPISA